MNWILVLLAFVTLFLCRALYYYLKLKQVRKLKQLYYEYIRGSGDYAFLQNKPIIVSLFEEAGLKNFSVTHLERISYGTALQSSLSGFDNLNSYKPEIVNVIKIRFEETIGVFKHRMRQSYNPMFWVEFIIRFPEKMLSYIGITVPDSMMKIIQILFWIAGLLTFLDKFNIIDVFSSL